jgi:CelD/BcsL family acetyltransferase involved in cellulose biosynthesis
MNEDPGQLITMATIQKAIEAGQQGLDFLRGDEPYKAHWRAVPRQTHDYRIVSRRTAAKLRHNLWIAADNMKHWVKGGMALMQGET